MKIEQDYTVTICPKKDALNQVPPALYFVLRAPGHYSNLPILKFPGYLVHVREDLQTSSYDNERRAFYRVTV